MGTVTNMQPTSVETGTTETIIGSGTVDEEVTSTQFTATVSALGTQLTSCSGDATQDIVRKLPMGVGKITVKALDFPIAAGSVSIPVSIETSSLIPASLANVDAHVAATDQNGESLICLDVHTAKAEEEVAAVKGATLAVTWSDCGAKHATVTNMQPTSVETGTTETIIGSGTVDEEVTSTQFTATVSALGTQLTSCSGDATQDIVCKLPMGVGKITVKALDFPIAAGSVSIPVSIETSSLIPASLANVDAHVAATDQNGESLICLDVHTAKAEEEVAAVNGACTSDEQAALADPQVVGDKANTCGTKSYNIITGKFDHDKFNACFTDSIGISTTCSECYAATGEYGAKNCKADCIVKWCKSGCLSCTAPAQVTLATCSGFTAATAPACDGQGFLATV